MPDCTGHAGQNPSFFAWKEEPGLFQRAAARLRRPEMQLGVLGALLLLPYLAAWRLGDLRQHTIGFEILFFIAFALYAVASMIALRLETATPRTMAMIFVLAVAMQGVLIFTRPTLSDDMYRYVWEGRLQGHGISPYWRPPAAPELAGLRDEAIWPMVNRKSAITVYPPVAQMAYALLWRIWPDSVRWFQIAMAAGATAAGLLLLGLLKRLHYAPARVLIYLWSPLLVFETAHAAHVDGLVLPLLVGAWLARMARRDWLVGVLLALATAMKLYPALLAPALWRPRHMPGRWQMPATFVITLGILYLPYVWWSGATVIGFLPQYFAERFNMGLAAVLLPLFRAWGIDPDRGLLGLTLAVLAILSGWMCLRPATNDAMALRRCIWLIGAFTLLTQNLFSWYMLWTLPLVALFLQPGRTWGLRLDGWTGWWLFSGLIALSYTFFINWRPAPLAIWAQFIPLYALLLVDFCRRLPVVRKTVKP